MTTVEHPTTETTSEKATPATPPGLPRRLSALPAYLTALAGGGALLLSFPLYNQWWLAPIGVALIAIAAHRRGFWGGLRLGWLAGLALFVPMLQWTHIVAGSVPWLLLAVAEAGYLGLLAAATAFVSPLVDRHRWSWPLVTAALWVGQEAFRDRAPFGGFPWGRLAFSQGNSPMLRYAVLGGAPFVTFMVALAGGVLALGAFSTIEAFWRRRVGVPQVPPSSDDESAAGRGGRPRRAWAVAAISVSGAGAIVVIGLAVPTSTPTGRAVEVAIIQGNVPRLGLEFNAQRRAVLDNHVNATLVLAQKVKAGKAKQPDLVIWPENSSDIDPLTTDDPGDSDATALINEAANAINAPILVGAVLEGPGANSRNAAIVWLPNGGPQSGSTGMYVKQHPVPFAEYIPLRSIARKVSSKVDLVTSDFIAGKTPGVLTMGPATIGDAICFEVAYDNIVRDTVTGGAQLLTVQTNNADFNPAEARQQMAMVRLRAVESGRDALMVSTVGISGFVDASGGVHDATGFNVQATELRQLRLGNQRTLATDLGEIPEFVVSGLAVIALAGAVWLRRRGTAPEHAPTSTTNAA